MQERTFGMRLGSPSQSCFEMQLTILSNVLNVFSNSKSGNIPIFCLTYDGEMPSPLLNWGKCEKLDDVNINIYLTNS